ncbi:MAG: DUF362 domain-containing protein [Candidatus Omnitrophica bacterium]|nr:DUF362 domain-containing protein [Candidatus Omnitrophota bacterium]
MKSIVYLIRTSNSDTVDSIKKSFSRLIEKVKPFGFIQRDNSIALKLHFGEEGNTGYVNPQYVRIVADAVKAHGGKPFLSDTNTLYRGKRTNSKDHVQLAYEHGFTPAAAGAEIIIPDDTSEGVTAEIPVNGKFVKTAKIARVFSDSDGLTGIAHFKGHIMTGFGGALKNLGMGCATREGKLFQHAGVAPFVKTKKCVGCGVCEKICPVKAITINNGKAVVDKLICIGCASCIAVCPREAIDIKWEAGSGTLQQKMIEYAKAVLIGKKDRTVFINFALKITKECDCLAKDDPRVAPDIGIFLSKDPVSIDKACFDEVCNVCGKDIFKELHPERNGMIQLKHAAAIGLGSLDYERVEIT